MQPVTTTVATQPATMAVVDLRPGADAEVRVDGGPGDIPILVVTTAGGEWLISPGEDVSISAQDFADRLALAAVEYRDRLRRYRP